MAENQVNENQVNGNNKPKRNKYADKMNKKGKIPKGVKIAVTALVIGGLAAGGVYLVKRTRQDTQTEQPKTAFAERGMLETYIEGDGSIAARKQEEVGKDLKGKVTSVLAEPGQNVKAGDLLFTVDPAETKEEIEKAKKDLLESQRSIEEAVSAVNTAQKNVSELTTTAPFSGKFLPNEQSEGETVKSLKNGDDVSGGTVIGTMVDDTVMRLPLYFSYAYIDTVQKGMTANVSIPASMSQVTGRVESVERVEKISASGTKLFKAVIAVNNSGTLTGGMTASAEIITPNGNIMPAESGKLEYNREETITIKQSGEITSIGTLDYYRFNAGAVLVRQKNDELVSAVEAAQRDLAGRRQAIEEKQKQIQTLEQQVANSNVTSPIDGVVLSMDAMVDTELSGVNAPCVVADMSSLIVKAEISMNDINSVSPGQFAEVSVQTNTDEIIITGTVESVALQANSDEGGNRGLPTYTAVIALDPLPEDVSISMGYWVQYRITTASEDDCIIIPARALVNTVDGTAVFAKEPEGGAFENTMPIPEGTEGVPEGYKLVPVAAGISDSTNVQILEGIDEGTEVFIAGPEDIYEQDMEMGVG